MNKRADEQQKTSSDAAGDESAHKTKSRKSVYIYVATLFLVAFLFMLLSYFVQERNDSEMSTLHEKNVTAQEKIENLQDENIQLLSDNEAYQQQAADFNEQVEALESQVADIRQQWLADVQKIVDSERERYNELLDQYNELLVQNENKVDNND